MPDMEAVGWVPLHRRIQNSPVWWRPKALQLFTWLFLNAAHEPRVDNSSGHSVTLVRGQVYASLAQAVEACPLSVKEVRNALAWLAGEGMIVRDSESSVITIAKYEEYQVGSRKDDAPHGDKGEQEREKKGQGNGHRNGQGKCGKKGKAEIGNNHLRDKDKSNLEDSDGAKQKMKEGQGIGQGKGQAYINKVKEVSRSLKKTTNPPTPFKKGGREISNSSSLLGTDGERVEMVLAMWREELTAAGLSSLEDKRNRDGAEILAHDYLGNAAMNLNTLRAGMKNLIHDIATDPKSKLFDLKTLARSPRRYCPAPVVVREKKRKVCWDFVCDVCGSTARTLYVDASLGTPHKQPCNTYSGCQGTMWPVKADEIER
jgi:hypothetical protein